jgi:transcription termination/antitermination protein NusG
MGLRGRSYVQVRFLERTVNEQPWRVLQVVANHEKQVGLHLEARSVEFYLPLYRKPSRWTDRTVNLIRPLFPGYVFVRFVLEDRLTVLKVPGVLRVLGNEHIGSIPAEEIDRIHSGLNEGYNIRPHPLIVKGARVRVSKGIFAGAEGVVAEFRRRSNVVLSLTSVDKRFSVETAIDDIDVLETEIFQKTPGMLMESI